MAKIPANSLEAFLAVARTGKFSLAAERLHISQSALSQRILNLESQLETTLFLRDRAGSQLTPEGENLLHYAQRQEALEEDFLAESSKGPGLHGSLRVGGFSSVMRSLALPALAPLARENGFRMSLFSRELHELPDLLRKGEADLVLLDQPLERAGVNSLLLGHEEYVLVRSKRWKPGEEFFLDHDEEDLTTQRYLSKFGGKTGQKRDPRGKKKAAHRYFDDVYGLIEGVRLGLGMAVLPRHLLEGERELAIVDPSASLKSPVWLLYPAQSYYPKLQEKAREALVAFSREQLPQK